VLFVVEPKYLLKVFRESHSIFKRYLGYMEILKGIRDTCTLVGVYLLLLYHIQILGTTVLRPKPVKK